MPDNNDPNSSSPSTTYQWRYVKIRSSAGTASKNGPAEPVVTLSRRGLRESTSMSVKHRGGAESWWEIHARGLVWRFPGYVTLDDALQQIYAGVGGRSPNPGARGQGRSRRR